MEVIDGCGIADNGAQMPQLCLVRVIGLHCGVVAPIAVCHGGKECFDGRSQGRLFQTAEDCLAVFDRVDGGQQRPKCRTRPWRVFVDAGEDLIEGKVVESVL